MKARRILSPALCIGLRRGRSDILTRDRVHAAVLAKIGRDSGVDRGIELLKTYRG